MSNPTVEARRAEVRALSELGLTELAKATDGVHSTHRAISDRVFSIVRKGVGPAAAPVKIVHDAITDGVYRTVSVSMNTAGTVSGKVADLPMQTSPSRTVVGAGIIGALNGLIGDELENKRSPLAAEPMTVRVEGVAVPPDPEIMSIALPYVTGRIAVFLHGLVETEHAWRYRNEVTYGGLLAANLDITPIDIRYNTGRRISSNGRALAHLLEQLVEIWPVPVTDISLIGHSMGGLVARSAVHHGMNEGKSWTAKVGTTVSLGTPHLGAPLEDVAHRGAALLTKFPETEAFGRFLRRRSGGIRDLRGGSLVDQDWSGRDPEDLARIASTEVPLHDGADHYFVSATLGRDPRHPLSRVIGDGLVLHHSASGRNSVRHIGFAPENGYHLGRATHFTLLNDDRVAEQLIRWLTPRDTPAASQPAVAI